MLNRSEFKHVVLNLLCTQLIINHFCVGNREHLAAVLLLWKPSLQVLDIFLYNFYSKCYD